MSQWPSGPRRRRPLDQVTIVVVDDDPDVRHLYVDVFEADGAYVFAYAELVAAQKALGQMAADVVLTDIKMPGRDDGYAVLAAVQRLAAEQGRAIPVVAVTAHVPAADRDAMLTHGFADFLVKPVDIDLLRTAIAALVTSRS